MTQGYFYHVHTRKIFLFCFLIGDPLIWIQTTGECYLLFLCFRANKRKNSVARLEKNNVLFSSIMVRYDRKSAADTEDGKMVTE